MTDHGASEASASRDQSNLQPDAEDHKTSPQSLARALIARRPEYVRPHRIRVKIGTWNVAGGPGADKDLASWFIDGKGIDKTLATLSIDADERAIEHDKTKLKDADADSVRIVGGDSVGLYVLGLQEIVDLNMTKEYVNRAVYTDSNAVDKWKAAFESAMPEGYELIASDQMSGLLLLIYASPTVAPTITNVSSKQVGTGFMGYFGNKGGVTTRIVLGETTRLVFTNCHLASGAGGSYLERRHWDVSQILSKTQFEPVVHSGVEEDDGEKIGDEDFAFWFGDLNFRLDGLPGDDIRKLLTLHVRGEYNAGDDQGSKALEGEGVFVNRDSDSEEEGVPDSSKSSNMPGNDTEDSLPDPDDFPEDPSQDPTSLQATIDSLLPHDQLRRSIAQGKAFHDGWREGPITFLPSYKYDVGTVSLFDTSEKQRSPSWCDRILYRTRKDKDDYESKIKESVETKKRDAEMRARGLEQDDDVLFSYDPDADGEDETPAKETAPAPYDEYDENDDHDDVGDKVVTKDGFVDHISLDIYTSHQRITSSDHKPVVSMFTLDYDAVVPELKAKVHAEVARELDRAENEGRPGVTIIVEGTESQDQAAVDFGDLSFLESKSTSMTVANTGSVAASFSFVEKPGIEDGGRSEPQWVYQTFESPEAGATTTIDSFGRNVTLEPGETIVASLLASITSIDHLQSLNNGGSHLSEVLVLRVDGGRDHFIPVHANLLPTSLGRSLIELVRVPNSNTGGIRHFVESEGVKGSIPDTYSPQGSAPKELFKLTEAITLLAERCVADEAMLPDLTLPRDAGWPFDAATWTSRLSEMEEHKRKVIEALDTDKPLIESLPIDLPSPNKLEAIASVLTMFLASLTDGLIPADIFSQLNSELPTLTSISPAVYGTTRDTILDVMSSSPNHHIALVFLTSMLARVAAELTPVTKAPQSRASMVSRRLSLRKVTGSGSGNSSSADDGTKKRRARERKYAEVFGPFVCRIGKGDEATAAAEKKWGEKGIRERERCLVEICLRRDDGA